MIQVISMDKRRFINRYKDFIVLSRRGQEDLADYIIKELKSKENSIIEISKWENGERK